jgi:tRNA threonylcarbamoyladenosine biosynthesis protein TsaB
MVAVDTATSACSVALADGADSTVAELNFYGGQTHSKHLATMLECLLEQARVRIETVDGFAVDAGPGTFTGLRIGLAAVKGLAAALQKPAVGVSSLDVLASRAGAVPGHICCMLDARRGEVYTARYATVNGNIEKLTPENVMAPQQAVQPTAAPCLYIGSGAVVYRDTIVDLAGETAWFAEADANHLSAAVVARLGIRKLLAGESGDFAQLVPNYIRRSDAETNKTR